MPRTRVFLCSLHRVKEPLLGATLEVLNLITTGKAAQGQTRCESGTESYESCNKDKKPWSRFESFFRAVCQDSRATTFSSNLEEFYMKAIKTLMAVSALATVAAAANATVYDMTAYTNTPFAAAGGNLIMDLSGTYDTTASMFSAVLGTNVTGVATLTGNVYIPGFSTSIHYNTMNFVMDGATGLGSTIAPDASSANCTDNTGSGCPGFSGALVFPLYNAINFHTTSNKNGTFDASSGTPFTAAPGTYTWTGIANVPVNGKNTLAQLPLTVTLSEQAPAVPVPAAAWLFGSGLLGLAGTARRRRTS